MSTPVPHLSLVPAAPPTSPARRAEDVATCGLPELGRRLGAGRRAIPYQVNLVRLLIAAERFPAPFPRARGAALLTGAAAVHLHARWDRRAVDAWFDDRLPPGACAARDAEQDAAAAALGANAADLDALLAARRRAS